MFMGYIYRVCGLIKVESLCACIRRMPIGIRLIYIYIYIYIEIIAARLIYIY